MKLSPAVSDSLVYEALFETKANMCHPILNLKKPPKTRKPLFFFFSFFSLSIKEEEEMEAILVDCVNCKPQSSPFHASKRHIHVRTALRRVPFRGIPKSSNFFLNFDPFCLVSKKQQEN